jgi:hypothetical protein
MSQADVKRVMKLTSATAGPFAGTRSQGMTSIISHLNCLCVMSAELAIKLLCLTWNQSQDATISGTELWTSSFLLRPPRPINSFS